MRVRISELAGPQRAEIFQKYPPHQPRCRCVAVAPRASHLLQCFPGNPSNAPPSAPPAPALRRGSGVAVMSLLLARRESRDPRPSGGANHGGLCCWEPEAFDQKEITKATCHSSQSTKHGFFRTDSKIVVFVIVGFICKRSPVHRGRAAGQPSYGVLTSSLWMHEKKTRNDFFNHFKK